LAHITAISVREAGRLVARLAGELGSLSAKRSGEADDVLADLMRKLVLATIQAGRAAEAQMSHLRALVNAHDPEAVLRRGFSITVDATGRALRDAVAAPVGSALITRLAQGTVHSTVTKAE
jgi:exodeoxyribonuclease VII large subunit